jgi:hypothetical protein
MSHSGNALLRQTGHPLQLQDQAQGDYRLVDIAATRSLIQLIGNVPPSFPVPAFGWQMPFYWLADVGERGQGHDGWDFQRPR